MTFTSAREGATYTLRRLLRRAPDEIEEEFRFHLEQRTNELLARGWPPASARAEAQRQFGDLEDARTFCRRTYERKERKARLLNRLGALTTDVRSAARAWHRSPWFPIIAVLILAFAIGTNAMMFSILRAVLVKPLAYPEPGRLVYITSQVAEGSQDHFPVDPAEYLELRERARSFDDVGAYATSTADIKADGRTQRVTAAIASASLFPTLGVVPLVGRTFIWDETRPGSAPVAVLSYELWKNAYQGDTTVVGSAVNIDGVETTVVGVMPPDFDIHDLGVKLWRPLVLDPAQRDQYRGRHSLDLVGRLDRDVSLDQARGELQDLLTRWATMSHVSQKDLVPNASTHRLRYDDLRTDIVGSVRAALFAVEAAAVVVLLIACANIAHLLLMRAEQRRRELALRVVLGGGHGRLLQQFMVDGLLLSLVGGILGFELARAALPAIVAASAGNIPRSASIEIDGTALLLTAVLVLGTTAVLGLVPFLHLKFRATGSGRHVVHRVLVATEFATAAALLVCAALLTRSFRTLLRVDAGFDRTRLTTFVISVPKKTDRDGAQRITFVDDLARALDRVPDVDAAAAMLGLPPTRRVDVNSTAFEGVPWPPGKPLASVDFYQAVTPGYFATMRVPIVAGRAFDNRDEATSPPTVIINESLARRFYPRQNPIGRRVQPWGDTAWFTVVGVAKDVKQGGLAASAGTELYMVYAQMVRQRYGHIPTSMNVVLRSRLTPATLAPIIQQTVHRLDATAPLTSVRSMDDVFTDTVTWPRFLAQIVGIFGAVALVLAAIGTYGVLAYSVAAHRQELSIRVALGASERSVLTRVVGQGMGLAGIGLTLGLTAAAVTTRLAPSLLFGVNPSDASTFVFVAAMLLMVAFLACLLPARRAMGVDPVVALRGA